MPTQTVGTYAPPVGDRFRERGTETGARPEEWVSEADARRNLQRLKQIVGMGKDRGIRVGLM